MRRRSPGAYGLACCRHTSCHLLRGGLGNFGEYFAGVLVHDRNTGWPFDPLSIEKREQRCEGGVGGQGGTGLLLHEAHQCWLLQWDEWDPGRTTGGGCSGIDGAPSAKKLTQRIWQWSN